MFGFCHGSSPLICFCSTLSCLSEYKFPQNRIKMETSVGGYASCSRPHKASVPAQTKGSVGAQSFGWLPLNVLLTVIDSMPECAWQVRGLSDYNKNGNMHRKCMSACVCVLFIAEHMQLCLRPQVCLSHHRYKFSSVLRSAVRLLSMCETLMGFFSHQSPSKLSCLHVCTVSSQQLSHRAPVVESLSNGSTVSLYNFISDSIV